MIQIKTMLVLSIYFSCILSSIQAYYPFIQLLRSTNYQKKYDYSTDSSHLQSYNSLYALRRQTKLDMSKRKGVNSKKGPGKKTSNSPEFIGIDDFYTDQWRLESIVQVFIGRILSNTIRLFTSFS